jgi:hypothetical protein
VRRRGAQLLALTAAAVLAGVIAVTVATGREKERAPLPAPATTWYSALAGVRAPAAPRTRTACGVVIGPATEGIAHAVLPCGSRLYVQVGGRTALTRVVDRMGNAAPREFDLTAALAERLGVRDVTRMRWTYAGTG